MSELQRFFYKNNRLQQLRGFCYTAQLGSISRAAELMCLSHTSVSLQIKALSEDLGIPLIVRKGPRISLTPEGKRLLSLAQPLIDGIHNLHHDFAELLQGDARVELDVALNSTSLNFIFPTIARAYIEQNPDTRITVHYAEQQEALEKIASDAVDMAILPRRPHMPFPKRFIYEPIFYYTPALITRPDHPLAGRSNLSVEEILHHDLTLPARDLRVIPDLYDVFDDLAANFKLRINFENWETTRKYIEEGLVISISSDVIISENDTLVATPLDHLFDMVDYGIVLKRGKRISDKIQGLIDVAKQHAATRRLQSGKRRLKA